MPHVDTECAWSQLLGDLGALLDDLSPNESMRFRVRHLAYYVSVRRAVGHLRLEAVSNGHLLPDERIDFEALDLLEDLGWSAPTQFVDDLEPAAMGSTNHFIDHQAGWLGSEVASVIVRTLRGVFEVACPDDLRCEVEPGGERPASPAYSRMVACTGEELAATPDPEVLADIIACLSAVTEVASAHTVPHTDGVVRIESRDQTITVHYDAANCLVRAAVRVVSGFPATAPALMAMNDCARPLRCGRLELRDHTVVALVDLPALDSIGDVLVGYLRSITECLDELRAVLEPFTAMA